MAVSGTQLAQEISDLFTRADYSDQSRFNRRWLNALCDGFETMWTGGQLLPGPGPPPGPNPHTHTFVPATGLDPTQMAGPPKDLFTGKDGVTGVFIDIVTTQTALFLIANTTMDIQDGTAAHKHLFLAFGVAAALESVLSAAVQGTGVFRVEDSFLPEWFEAFSSGLLAHLTSNADMAVAAGAGHTHVLL